MKLILFISVLVANAIAGFGDFLIEFFGDDNGSQERWEAVKDHYDWIEHWGESNKLNLSNLYKYDPQHVALNRFIPVEAEYSNNYLASGSVTLIEDSRYTARVYILPGQGDSKLLNRPLIVGDAFDPLDERSIEDLIRDDRYSNLLKKQGTDHFRTPREMGYDIVFIDFDQGGGRLNWNAVLVTKVIQEIHRRTDSPIVLAGISMSGILARVAQLYAMPKNNLEGIDLFPQVIGWLSIDSPQDGAVITPLQRGLWSMIQDEDLAAGMELQEADNSLAIQYFKLNVPGAHQMLKNHYYPKEGRFSDETFKNFQSWLVELGSFPRQFGVGLAYSNFNIPYPNIDPKKKQIVKKLQVPEVDYSYDIQVGGWANSPRQSELEPGSTGNWYYQVFEQKQGEYMKDIEESRQFAGTFVPIRSALSLNVNNIFTYSQLAQDSLINGEANRKVSIDSRFDEVFWMGSENRYQDEFSYDPTIEDLTEKNNRYEHMVFDSELMSLIEGALDRIELQSAWTPVMGQF